MIFFSCMRDEVGGSFGVIIYPSAQEYLAAAQRRATSREEMRSYIESNVYTVTLTPCQEEVPEDMRKVCRRLGLDFTGGLWPCALHKRRGYLGAVPEGDDLAFLLDCLGNFHMQIKALRQGALQGKLKEGDMVLRFRLEDEREPWKTTLLPSLCRAGYSARALRPLHHAGRFRHAERAARPAHCRAGTADGI